METLPTQDVCDGDYSEEDESSSQEATTWGRLFPLGDSFIAVGKIPDTAAILLGQFIVLGNNVCNANLAFLSACFI